jgi:mono/diheme cytochrome c family protein
VKKGLWLLCLCVWMAGCEQGSSEPKVAGRWYAQSQVDLGKKVYADNCISCHREDAQGTFNWKTPDPDGKYPPPPLNGTAHAWHHPFGVLKRVIDDGGVPLGGKMPGFKEKLNDEEKLAVISYFQSFWSDEIYNAWISRGGLK